jgi:mRNA interferase MazF
MPRRGEVWLVDLGLAQKIRPALILSTAYSDAYRALITVISHTTKIRGSKFEQPVSAPFLKQGAFVVRRLGTLSAEELKAIEDGVRHWLAL